ncbi:MAG: hypothetical protein JSS49_28335 [Planctomycetes bacterium]|nr:hypothetical protein [Planctomycetota bacterium]
MIARFMQSDGLKLIKTGLAAAVVVLGVAASSYACGGSGGGGGSQGGGGGSGGRGAVGAVGTVASGVTSAQSQAIAYANQAQFVPPQNMYLSGMYAQQNQMMRDVHQWQARQLMAIRQSRLNKKNAAGKKPASGRAVNVSFKPDSKSAKSAKPS